MFHKLLALALTTALSSALAAPVTLNLSVMNGDQPFTGTVKTSGGQTITLDQWKLYVSNVALIRADGSEQPISGLKLVKIAAGGPFQNVTMFKGNAPTGDYKGVRFAIGVPRAQNHADATLARTPLTVDDGMYWAWNSGYIFSRFEGKVDVAGTPVALALHFGEDKNYAQIGLADLQKNTIRLTVTENGLTIPIHLDAAKYVGNGVSGEKYDASQAKYQQVHFGAVADQLRMNLVSAFSLGLKP